MKQIDLDPREYRRKGTHWLPHPLDGPRYTIWGILCGLWFGCVVGTARLWISGDNPWVIAGIALAPAAVWAFFLLRADKP